MKRGSLVTLAVVAVLLVGVGGCLVGNYNRLVTTKESVDQRWAQVDNQLKRRNDLIGSLVETVKGTAIQEQEVFGAIANARSRMAGARTPAEGIQAGQASVHVPVRPGLSEEGLLPRVHGLGRGKVRVCSSSTQPSGKGNSCLRTASHSRGATSATRRTKSSPSMSGM